MAKRLSLRFDAAWMAYHIGKKPPTHAKVTPTTTPYDGTNVSEFNSDFGTASSGLTPYTYTDPVTGKTSTKMAQTNTMSLSPQLQQANQTAQSGLNQNLSYLQQTPDQAYANIAAGNDPTYNAANIASERATQQNLDRAKVMAQTNGGLNSTAYGGAMGTIANDDILRQNQLASQIMAYNNQMAQSNAATNMGTLSGLYGLVSPMASATSGNLNTAAQTQAQAMAQTAAAQNAEAQRYAALQDQYNEWKRENGVMGTLSTLFPAVGFTSGNADLGWKGMGNYAQIAGTVLGAAMGNPAAGGGGSMANTFGTLPGGQINYRIPIQ